jgi:RNA polymerase sigma-B factor
VAPEVPETKETSVSASIDYHVLDIQRQTHEQQLRPDATTAGSVRTRPVSRIYPAPVVEGGAFPVRQVNSPADAAEVSIPDTGRAQSREPDRSARVAALLSEMIDCQDPARRRRLQSAVVVEHMGVARSIASRYRGRGVERGDLEQLACLGLVKAVSRWLPGLSDDFLQFAVPTISGEIKRYFRDHSWLVRPPRRIQELRAAINVAERDFQDSGELRPTDRLVSQRLGVRESDIREARAAAGLCRPPSLDSDSGAGLFIAQQWSGEDTTTAVDDRMSLDVVLDKLTQRERRVVSMRFSEGLSQARIGEVIGVSQMQVSRILRDVLNKLRDHWEQ